MVGWLGSVRGVCGLVAIGLPVLACGGQSRSSDQDEPGAGATGGSGGSGGSVGGSGGSVGGSGGNVGGSGGNGGSGGTVSDGCFMNGLRYPVGTTFPAGDSCNTCTCVAPESAVCTRTACVTCATVSAAFDDAMLEARRCDPGLGMQCGELVPSGLQCGCPTFVNSSGPVTSSQDQWATLGCSVDIACGACPSEPVRGECATEGINEGFCVDVYEDPPPEPASGCFSYLGDWILCEESGGQNTMQVVGATELEDCMARCAATPGCTAVTDYFWLDRPDLGCWLHLSTCDSPGPEVWAEEDGGKQYRKVCDP